jgi:hypothetical protein
MTMTPVTIIKAVEGPWLYKVKDMNQCTIGIYSDVPGRITLHYVGHPNLLSVNRKYKSVESMMQRWDWRLAKEGGQNAK